MPLRRLVEGLAFSPEEIAVMAAAYEAIRRQQHDRGQPEAINEIIAKRIIDLAKLRALEADELAARVLSSFGLKTDKGL